VVAQVVPLRGARLRLLPDAGRLVAAACRRANGSTGARQRVWRPSRSQALRVL
jgi:hypothetical protein